jgi:hypothetical protein
MRRQENRIPNIIQLQVEDRQKEAVSLSCLELSLPVPATMSVDGALALATLCSTHSKRDNGVALGRLRDKTRHGFDA